MRRGIRGKVLSALSSQRELLYLDDALVWIGADGRIESVEPYAPERVTSLVRDVRPFVITPGFVDAHLHFPQARIVGRASGPLLQWLDDSVFPEEARFSDAKYALLVAEELVTRFAEVGTTTAVLFSSSSSVATQVLFDVLARSGLRAVAGLVLMDQFCPPSLLVPKEEALSACVEIAEAFHGFDRGRLHVAMTPRFAPTCSMGLLEEVGRLAEERGLFVQTHLSENLAECARVREVHPWASDYLNVYEKTGLLGPRTLLAHSIHLSSSEWDRVGETNTRIVHCPDSNFFLGSGRMPLAEAKRRKIQVALGSDVAGGRSFDMRLMMSSAYDNALALGQTLEPAELFRMATLGGAEVLGMEREIGSLEAGKDADYCVIELPRYAEGLHDVLSRVVFEREGVRVREAYVRGKRLS